MKRQHSRQAIDYFKHKPERKKLATYLRSTSCRKISGAPTFSDKIVWRRRLVSALALIILLTGLYKIFA